MKALRLYAVAALENGDVPALADGTTVLNYRQVGAVVEPAEYAETKGEDALSERYSAVLEQAFRYAAVLPAPPGTVFKSKGTLSHWLELHYFTLTDALSLIEDHVAGRVTITSDPRVTEPDTDRSLQSLGAEILRLLRTHADATVVLPLDEEDVKEGVVMRASFLLPSERWQAFNDSVSVETKRQPALELRLTGPWPPYDFVRMQFRG